MLLTTPGTFVQRIRRSFITDFRDLDVGAQAPEGADEDNSEELADMRQGYGLAYGKKDMKERKLVRDHVLFLFTSSR